MKFAMRDQRLRQILDNNDQPDWVVTAFFFHDRGSEVQKSLSGMFQEILGSILRHVPALVQFVFPLYTELVKSQKTRKPSWNLDVLKSGMLSIMKQRTVRTRLLLFLDALDEHDGDNDVLTLLLKDLVASVDNDCIQIKLCLASRSWTVFGYHFGECPGFAIHDHTEQDIRIYVADRLDVARQTSRSESTESIVVGAVSRSTGANLLGLVNLVAEKAAGVFIWVR